jgi:aquaporin related protein
MLAAEKHKGTFLAPIGIGLALFVAELAGVYWTGGSLNPARSFGPAVVTGFSSDHWVYWVGPGLGAILAVLFYRLVKILEYETVNPGQDYDGQTGARGVRGGVSGGREVAMTPKPMSTGVPETHNAV